LAFLFTDLTPQLQSIMFTGVALKTPELSMSCDPRPKEQRAQIRRLKIVALQGCPLDWLTFLSCPFDFSQLAEVHVDRFDAYLVQLLLSARLAITRLEIFGGKLSCHFVLLH
jgi:hypothetical protein